MVSFLVQDIEDLVLRLQERGVQFVPLPASAEFGSRVGDRSADVTDFGPVRSAFLRDSEGNLLALNELVR